MPPLDHRSGFIALAGRPNVGKSTLVNRLLGQPVAAVSFRPQTTRRRQLGILTLPHAQVVFVDAPGLHRPVHRLGEALNQEAEAAISEADVVLAIFDLSADPTDADRRLGERVRTLPERVGRLAALNKLDLVAHDVLVERARSFAALLPGWETVGISASLGDGCPELLERLIDRLPPGPAYFPEEQVTDALERDIAADLIRAAAMDHLREEVPYSLAVRVTEFIERGEKGARIAADVLVDRESQKGIVIGRGGERLKAIGRQARLAIEAMSGRSCYLELSVRVQPGAGSDPETGRAVDPFSADTESGG